MRIKVFLALSILFVFSVAMFAQGTCTTSNATLRVNGRLLVGALDVQAGQLRRSEDAVERTPHTGSPADKQRYDDVIANHARIVTALGVEPKTKKLFADANNLYSCVLSKLGRHAPAQPLFEAGENGTDLILATRELERSVGNLHD